MSSIEKLKSEYDNVSTIENPKTKEKSESEKKPSSTAGKPKSQIATKPKTNEKSERNTAEDGKPSPNTAEKSKLQIAIKSKKPKRELTDSEYERFMEYEELRKAVKLPPLSALHSNSDERIPFKMEVTPKHLLIDPDESMKIIVKNLVKKTFDYEKGSQNVLVEVDSILFQILDSNRKFGLKSQLMRKIDSEKTLEFEIVLKNPKEMQKRLFEHKKHKSMDTSDLAGVVRVYHKTYGFEWGNFKRGAVKRTRSSQQIIDSKKNAARREYPIRLTKETESVKKLEMLYNVILVECERQERFERNVFEMRITPDGGSIDPNVPFKVVVKSLAKEKQKLIIDLKSFFYKILNATGQKDYATQISCTIMPGETMDFKIVLRSESEAMNCLKTSTYSETTTTGNLTITHIKCHLKDKETPPWTPYKPPQQGQEPAKPSSVLVNAKEERLDREHGICEGYEVAFIRGYRGTEATTKLDAMFDEHTGRKAERDQLKKKKCVIQ